MPRDVGGEIRNMLHMLRVDPLDETTRLVLADLTQEYFIDGLDSGRVPDPGNELAVARMRQGRILPAALDMEAVRWLKSRVRANNRNDLAWARHSDLRIDLAAGRGLDPCDYYKLWTLACKYRRQIEDPAVRHEAELVRADRRTAEAAAGRG